MDCAAPSFPYVPLVSIRRRRSQRALSIFRRTLAVRFPKIGCIGSEHLCYLLNVKPGYRFWLSDSNCRVGRTTSPCTLVSRLAENPVVSEETMRALAGHVSPRMLAWYSHIRTDAKRAVTSALDQIGDAWEVADSGRGTAQNWAQSHAVPKHTLN